MGLFGGSQKNQIVTQKSNPYATAQPGLDWLFSNAFQQAQAPMEQFGPSAIAGYGQDTLGAFEMLRQQASQPNALVGSATNLANRTMGGEFLGPNPHLDAVTAQAIRPMRNEYAQQRAGLAGGAGRVGMFGSDVYDARARAADSDYQQNVGDLTSRLGYQNYDAERQRQQSMMSALPGLMQAQNAGAQTLLGVGQAQDALTQARLTEQAQRHQQAQMDPWQRMGLLQQVLGAATPYAVQQQITPMTKNTMAGILGGAGAGAQMGSAAGPWGMLAGAAAGGIMGGMS